MKLSELVQGFVEREDNALALRDAVQRHVERASRRYPDAYFELGQRTPEAVEGLADRVFVSCARVPKGRFPFLGRQPFAAYVEEDFDDQPIRYHSFYAKLSITRELLRDDYAFNLRRDPRLRWRDELHRAVGAALKETCTPTNDQPGAHRRWKPSQPGLSVARPLEEVHRRLVQAADRPIAALVPMALSLAGQPLSHSQLTNLLADALQGPAPEAGPPDTEGRTLPDILTVRRAVYAAWAELSGDEQQLIAALARGEDYDTLIARVPSFANRSAVSRAVSRCGKHFVARVAAAVGAGDATPSATPRSLMEPIIHVLLPLLPEPESLP